jgi:hypothetical protein
MNYTPLDQAYNIHHINSNTYGGHIIYSPICIYCKNNQSISLFTSGIDGGSFRQCSRCKKNFRANVINNAINNFSYSTHHLKGTN